MWSRRRKCSKLVSYQSRNLEFNSDIGGGTFVISKFKIENIKIEEASELAKTLSDYIYTMCELYSEFDKTDVEFKKYFEEQENAIKLLTALRVTLIAFDRDPAGQRKNLDQIIKHLQNFMVLRRLVDNEDQHFQKEKIGYALEVEKKISKEDEIAHPKHIEEILALYQGLRKSELRISLNTTDLLRLGNYFYYSNKHEKALDLYDDVLERDQNNAVAWSNKARVLMALGRISEVEHCVKKIKAIGREDLAESNEAAYSLASIEKNIDNIWNAKNIASDEDIFLTLVNLAAVYNNPEISIRIYERIIDAISRGEIRPYHARFWSLRGLSKIVIGDLDGALLDLEAAIKIDKDNSGYIQEELKELESQGFRIDQRFHEILET